MGEKVNRNIEAGSNETPGNNSSTASTTDGGRRRGRPAGSTKEKELPGLATLSQPKIVQVEVPGSDQEEKPEKKPGRGRPAGKTKKKASAKTGQADHTQLKVLLVTISGIMAGKMQSPVFMLTNEEAEQIAKPLANIMSRNEGVSAITNEYADHIALAFACLTIFVPKYFMWKSTQPKKEVKKNVQPVSNPGQSARSTAGHSNQSRTVTANDQRIGNSHTNTRAVSNDSPAFNGAINDLMPAIAGF